MKALGAVNTMTHMIAIFEPRPGHFPPDLPAKATDPPLLGLTVGNQYEILASENGYLTILDDLGYEDDYPARMFRMSSSPEGLLQ